MQDVLLAQPASVMTTYSKVTFFVAVVYDALLAPSAPVMTADGEITCSASDKPCCKYLYCDRRPEKDEEKRV